jgi:hypothetical protein
MKPLSIALLILEGKADSCAISHHLALVDFQVELGDFSDAQFLEAFRCGVHGVLGRILPRLAACSDQFDDFVNTLGHEVLLSGEHG